MNNETQLEFDFMHENSILWVSNSTLGELLRIDKDGTVWAPSIESASEASRVFVETIRQNLKNNSLQFL